MRALVLLLLLLTGLSGLSVPVYGQSADTMSVADTTVHASGDWLVLPYASYEPKTRIAIGVVAGYYQAERPGRIPSSVQSVVTITQERQIVINVAPEFYLQNGRYRLAGEMEASRFPDSFFGIGGDTPSSAEEDFTSRYLTLEATAQKRVRTPLPGRFVLGPRMFVRLENMTEVEDGGQLATTPVAGADGGRTLGVGLGALWDDRDNIYYPREGHFLETSALWHSAIIGSDFTFGRFLADLRAYRSAGPVVFAGHVYAEGVTGTPAFQTLPLLGGSERMRGYLEGRYRDAVYWTTQAEVRIPLFWRFGATAFASAGEVSSGLNEALVRNVQVAAGVGGRLRLNDEGVHGRMDIAYGANGLELYLSLLEAF